MKRKPAPKTRHRVADFVQAMDALAPVTLAQGWDNVGLLAGDAGAALRSVLLCIDLTPDVADEAIALGVDCVMAYHPPIFKPIARLTAAPRHVEAAVYACVRHGIAIYSTHTALDAAEGGTNDVLAELCGVIETEPLEYVPKPGHGEYKVVVFVPSADADRVADAMFAAGAGRIGDYTSCSFRTPGEGTFFGEPGANPAVGRAGKLERVQELRLETVVPAGHLSAVLSAMRATHPYEEPAHDVYALHPPTMRGIGRVGMLPRAISLAALARSLKRKTQARALQIVGEPETVVSRGVFVAGAAGSLAMKADLSTGDVVVTGEIRHHDALTILRHGATAVALGHWTSERPTLGALAGRLSGRLIGVRFELSRADREVFASM